MCSTGHDFFSLEFTVNSDSISINKTNHTSENFVEFSMRLKVLRSTT